MRPLTATINFPKPEGRGAVYRIYEINDNPVIVIFDEDMDMRLVCRIKANIAGFPSDTLMIGERKGSLTAILRAESKEAEYYFKNIAENENGLDVDPWSYSIFNYQDFEELDGHITHPSMSKGTYISLIHYVLPAFVGLK